MVAGMLPYFDQLYSVELDRNLYEAATKRFRGQSKARFYLGDSAVVIQEILTSLKEPALFWLDAHYSGGITARGESDTPIDRELQAILTHGVRGHVILIDDARNFGADPAYPSIESLKVIIAAQPIRRDIYISEDIIRITPAIQVKG